MTLLTCEIQRKTKGRDSMEQRQTLGLGFQADCPAEAGKVGIKEEVDRSWYKHRAGEGAWALG